MEISPRQLKKFKKIYKAQFGEDLPDDKAKESAMNLIILVKAVFKPTQK